MYFNSKEWLLLSIHLTCYNYCSNNHTICLMSITRQIVNKKGVKKNTFSIKVHCRLSLIIIVKYIYKKTRFH